VALKFGFKLGLDPRPSAKTKVEKQPKKLRPKLIWTIRFQTRLIQCNQTGNSAKTLVLNSVLKLQW